MTPSTRNESRLLLNAEAKQVSLAAENIISTIKAPSVKLPFLALMALEDGPIAQMKLPATIYPNTPFIIVSAVASDRWSTPAKLPMQPANIVKTAPLFAGGGHFTSLDSTALAVPRT